MYLETHDTTSLVIFLGGGGRERNFKFHTMPCSLVCAYVQFYNSKVLRSKSKMSATSKMGLFVTITASIF